ncbi:MAG: TIGR02281 family clan AA aspartic protease [Pseudomonadota bacterium]
MLDRILFGSGLVIVAGIAFGSITPIVPSDGTLRSESDRVESSGQNDNAYSHRSIQPQSTVWDAPSGHTLTRQRDGHFYASARVEGRNVRMMVDTGASVIALTGRDASAIGLRWNESDVRPVARGANGTVYGVRTRLRDVEIGGMQRQNVSAMIIPRGLDVSLLGQSYLSQIGTVEISNNQMILSDR